MQKIGQLSFRHAFMVLFLLSIGFALQTVISDKGVIASQQPEINKDKPQQSLDKQSEPKPTDQKEKQTAKKLNTLDRFQIVLLPDTQLYSLRHPETYKVQTHWIRRNSLKDNTKFVIHLGDIVHNNTEKEWKAADQAQKMLDGNIPYSMVPGNHDMVKIKKKITRNTTRYNKYFSPLRFANAPWYGGHYGKTNDNNYCFFKSHGMKFMVLSLEFCPRDEVLEWAAKIVEKYPEHRVILATHNYLNTVSRDIASTLNYRIKGNTGQQMWTKLISKQKNIFMVVCGHVPAVNFQKSKNKFGGEVLEILTDYQNLKNGGNGWLRTLTFVPQENKIYVGTYSPLIDRHNKKPNQTFTIDYQMTKKEAK